ncbi:hypothetical protein GH714_034313 [Hevea brasiliensis]|uniref:Mei2-like C-terminal RNA recognition motif domain-containing protein n=1 Tax=Hevea brasiliensis TaxID=3981 RepID=A0A6A6M7U9_HEVBR|nr:hypothetical protein GH714_034313 [Hevea brasiliensis]
MKTKNSQYTSKTLVAAIDGQHNGTYDFIYLPINFKAVKYMTFNLWLRIAVMRRAVLVMFVLLLESICITCLTYVAQDASIAFRLPEFIIVPEMSALSIRSILPVTMPPKVVGNRGRGVNCGHVARRIRLFDAGQPHRDLAVPLPPPEEVVDYDELHKGRDEHGDFSSHGIVSGAYVAPPPPHPLAPIEAPLIPSAAPLVPPTATPPIPPTVPVAPFPEP